MVCGVVVEPAISFRHRVDRILEGEMGEGEQRRDDAGGVGRYFALITVGVADDLKAGLRGRCEIERAPVALIEVPEAAAIIERAEALNTVIAGITPPRTR